jgi:hypothetical protein
MICLFKLEVKGPIIILKDEDIMIRRFQNRIVLIGIFALASINIIEPFAYSLTFAINITCSVAHIYAADPIGKVNLIKRLGIVEEQVYHEEPNTIFIIKTDFYA